jgi:ribosome-associated translation inhibitor RaiA
MRGGVAPSARDQVESGLAELVRFAPRPLLHATVTLTLEPDPALERPALAKATLDVSGRPLVAQASAPEMTVAVTLLLDRLRRGLREQAERYAARRRPPRTRSRKQD